MKISKKSNKKMRHNPLHIDNATTLEGVKQKRKRAKYSVREEERELKADGAKTIDAKMSKRILEEAQQQLDEIKEEENQDDGIAFNHEGPQGADSFGVAYDEDQLSDLEEESVAASDDEEPEEGWEEWDQGIDEMNEEDQRILNMFSAGKERNLADLIMEKFKQNSANAGTENSVAPTDHAGPHESGLSEKIVQVYEKVGLLLSRYKSGKLPKAFKILPSLKNWFQILPITQPDSWTDHSLMQATRLFVSNLKPKDAQLFLREILLPRFRLAMAQYSAGEVSLKGHKKISIQLYMALKKGLYKPAAFFKGILFPLLQEGCTLKEAMILSSVLKKSSVPVLHASAALMKLVSSSAMSQEEYNPSTSVFIGTLLDKRFALPYRVLEECYKYFVKYASYTPNFSHSSGMSGSIRMPVLWHQSLLVFVQRYKMDLTEEQRAGLLQVLDKQWHREISPEIKRELTATADAKGRMDLDR